MNRGLYVPYNNPYIDLRGLSYPPISWSIYVDFFDDFWVTVFDIVMSTGFILYLRCGDDDDDDTTYTGEQKDYGNVVNEF